MEVISNMELKVIILLLLLAAAAAATKTAPEHDDATAATHVQIPSAMILHPHLFKTSLNPFRSPHAMTSRGSAVDGVRIHDEFSHRDAATGHVVEMTAISATAPNVVYLDLLPNVEAVQCTHDALEIFFSPLTADAKARATLTFGTKAKHYSSVTHVTGGNKWYCASGAFVQQAVTSVIATSDGGDGRLSSIKLATRDDDQFMFAHTDYKCATPLIHRVPSKRV
jgi:hypothetical protein